LIIDTSALLAIVFDEPDGPKLLRMIVDAPQRAISTANLLEAWMVVDRHSNPTKGKLLENLLSLLSLELRPVTDAQIKIAREAYAKYGKGRHPAKLNFGDCFAYALAKLDGGKLLYKGDDFSKTDLRGY